jgi:hypothetical protein
MPALQERAVGRESLGCDHLSHAQCRTSRASTRRWRLHHGLTRTHLGIGEIAVSAKVGRLMRATEPTLIAFDCLSRSWASH